MSLNLQQTNKNFQTPQKSSPGHGEILVNHPDQQGKYTQKPSFHFPLFGLFSLGSHNSLNFPTVMISAGISGLVNFSTQGAVQHFYSWQTAGIKPNPPVLRSVVPSVALFFTSYEILKYRFGVGTGEHGYSRHVRHSVTCDGNHQFIESHVNCRGPFTLDQTLQYFTSAAVAGAMANSLTFLVSDRLPAWYRAAGQVLQVSASDARARVLSSHTIAHNISLAATEQNLFSHAVISSSANVALTALRFGIQFTVFEQVKNWFASHKLPGHDLTGLEIFAGAAAGGLVAVAAVHPLQRAIAVKLPCSLSSSLSCSLVPKLPLSKASFYRCLLRFGPISVATAMSYEFALRLTRHEVWYSDGKSRYQQNAFTGFHYFHQPVDVKEIERSSWSGSV